MLALSLRPWRSPPPRAGFLVYLVLLVGSLAAFLTVGLMYIFANFSQLMGARLFTTHAVADEVTGSRDPYDRHFLDARHIKTISYTVNFSACLAASLQVCQ